ncbi:hypothetical protein [Deinococcus petrolearius]|uniref:DUF2790 domain-containing protein n=1 Tax=Deinococcus petrolearius TaxID=1751295 RepID=A0ABW1DP08_9DEIO
MRRLITVGLMCSTALGLSAQDVNLLENTGVLGPVRTSVQEDTAATNFTDSEVFATIQTLSYDRSGYLLKMKTQYYEGSRELKYEYVGNCVKREYEESGYG